MKQIQITNEQYTLIQDALSEFRWSICCKNREKIKNNIDPDDGTVDNIDELKDSLFKQVNK